MNKQKKKEEVNIPVPGNTKQWKKIIHKFKSIFKTTIIAARTLSKSINYTCCWLNYINSNQSGSPHSKNLWGPPRGMGISLLHSLSNALPSFTARLQCSNPDVYRSSLLPPITWSLPLQSWVAGAYLNIKLSKPSTQRMILGRNISDWVKQSA